jgi:quinol monooxygenase YgiN
MYGLIGKFRAKPGQRDALIAAMLDDDTPIPGCRSFVVATDPADADLVWITEVWDDQAAHKGSLELPSVKASIERAMPLIAAFEMNAETSPVGGIGLSKLRSARRFRTRSFALVAIPHLERNAMLRFILLMLASFLVAGAAIAKDAFDAVTCDGDVAKTLIGASMPNTPVEALEKKYTKIALKDVGGDEVSDTVSYTEWSICGHSYHVLEKDDAVGDVLAVDTAGTYYGLFSGCTSGGKTVPSVVFVSLAKDASGAGAKIDLTNRSINGGKAWRVDEKKVKFVPMQTEGLTCNLADLYPDGSSR